MDSYLVGYLADNDIACPGCRYNLRGLRDNACPECGTELILRVAVAEPRLAVFLSAVIALASGLGFNAFILMWLTWQVFRFGSPWSRMWTLFVATPLLAIATVLLCRHRQWLRRRSRVGQALVIAGCVVGSIGSVIAFFAVVSA